MGIYLAPRSESRAIGEERVWRCFVRDQARVPSVAGAGSSLFRKTEQFFFASIATTMHCEPNFLELSTTTSEF